VAIVERLLSHEPPANVNARNTDGKTQAFFAVVVRRIDILALLIDAGAQIAVADNYSRTPIEEVLVDHGLSETFIEAN
jgi:ankyrin repeat protein